jgi:multidrug efflux pump subunit AcrA (membrane-fusion protein)
LAGAILGLTLVIVFLVPVPFNVGGEAEVAPRHRHVAFCQVEGIIEKILVTEGASVTKGQVVAVLDPTELDHKITLAVRQVQLLNNEAEVLQRSSFENIAKLAEGQLSALKLKRAEAELDFLRWQRRFIEIKAPADGVVVTKQVESLVGKKFAAGESFCEIASPGELCVEIWVPEDRAAIVQVGQEASLYLNSDPLRKYPLRVSEVSPKSEPVARVGNVYRVRGSFVGQNPHFSVGQKGTGSICTGTRSLWFIISQRVGARWNEFSRQLW